MKPPHTYSEWVDSLDALKIETNEEEIIRSLEQGSIEWSSGVAERLISHLSEVVDCRLHGTAELLQRDLRRQTGSGVDVARAMLGARRRLELLIRIVSIPCLPDYVRHGMSQIVVDYASRAQSALEDSAKQDRTGRTLNLVRSNPLTGLGQQTTSPTNSLAIPINPVAGTGGHQEQRFETRHRRAVILP